jgi:general secretion pathway protein G
MKTRGFTLIELLIVVAIIGIIVAIAIPNLLVALQKGNQKATMADMTSLGSAVESYLVDFGIAPAVGGTIITDLDQDWFRPFYIKILPRTDGWGTLFLYEAGTGSTGLDCYSITSLGRNKINDHTVPGEYPVLSMLDFNREIVYSDGRFTVSPQVKK